MASFLLVSTLVAASAGRAPRDKPNILLFFVDDLGYGDLGFTGAPSSLTPQLDRLAFEGRRLSTWYSGYPVCTASRTALLTGRQPPRVGMPGVINSLAVEGLPLNETTLADYLKAAGYRTLAVGKWHQGQRPAYLPLERGFDEFFGLPFSVDDGTAICSHCQPHLDAALGDQWPLPLIEQSAAGSWILNQPTDLEPLSRSLGTYVKNFTTRHRNEPWFAYVAHPHVHTATPNIDQLGYEQYARCPFANSSRRGPFGDAVSELDWMVGDLVDHVDSLGLSENTLVIFTSDNGPWLAKGLGAGSAGPFAGASAGYSSTAKGSTWEGGLRVPAFVYWPGTVAAHSRSLETISTLDLVPSLLALVGAAPVLNRVLDGVNNLDVLLGTGSGKSGWRDRLLPFWTCWGYKVHWITSTGLVESGHALENTTVHEPPLVFDVDQDPAEAHPLGLASLPPGFLETVAAARGAHMASVFVRSIDKRFGNDWLLCCDRSTNCTCASPVPLVEIATAPTV